jgi:hypothetical protein
MAVHDALTAEGEACVAALHAAMDVGISHVVAETDAANLVSAICSSALDQSPGGVVFKEIRHLLEFHFVSHGVFSVPRSCNRCAHELARSGLTWDPDIPIIWDDPLPSSVTSLVDDDKMSKFALKKKS